MRRRPAPPSECPVCGADLPSSARACPECGADERTGWNEDDTRYDGVDLPDSAFDDRPPPSARAPGRSFTRSLLWPAVGILLVILLVHGLLGGR